MIISISIIAWGKETTHTQHSHRHTTRVSVRVISAKDRPPSQRQRHTPTDAKRKGRAEGRRPASRPANRTQSQPHQPTTSSSPRAAGGVYSAPSHGGEKRRTVPPDRRGARQYGPSPHAHAPYRRARSSQRHPRASPRRLARRPVGQKASSACEAQPSHTHPDQRAPPTRAGPIHSNQHAKSVCWCPAHRPRAGRPNT